MDIRRIEYFIRVAETLNFSEAARKLHISHQALSRQIQILEQETGVRLLERSTTRVALTEVGRKVYELYVPVLDSMRRAQAELKEFIRYKKNTLRVGYFDGLSYPRIVAPLLRYIRSVVPDITINVRAMFIDTEREALNADELDLVVSVMTDPDEWEKMEILTLVEEDAFILVGENHPWSTRESVSVEDIAQETLIEYDRANPEFSVYMPRIRAGMRMRVPNLETYMARIDQGDAFAVIGRGYSRREGTYRELPLPAEYRGKIPVICAFKRLHPMADILRSLKNVRIRLDVNPESFMQKKDK